MVAIEEQKYNAVVSYRAAENNEEEIFTYG
jgi:hypothetical protein